MQKKFSAFANKRFFLRKLLNKDIISFRLLVGALVTGCITGIVCAFFEAIPDALNHIRTSLFIESSWSPIYVYMAAFALSAILGGVAIYFTKKYAPEAGGSGIPEIEGAMIDLRPVRYKRVLPVKFFCGLLSLSSGMILGREGPSIQIGGNLGAMVSDKLKFSKEDFHTLLAAGAASGLASAFNAPLAGIMFVLEELRMQFKFSFSSVQAVTVAVIFSTICRDYISSTNPVFALPNFANVDLHDLVCFLMFGVIIGLSGVLFNRCVAFFQDFYQFLHKGKLVRTVIIVSIVAGCFGALSIYEPQFGSSGMAFIPNWVITSLPLTVLLVLLLVRLLGIFLCFCSGIPGGIFAPSLSIGTLLGSVFGIFMVKLGYINFDPGIMAIVGMGAFFAASVRAPVTGIILVCEMTNNFQFLLPMLVTVFTAVYVAALLNGKPIYSQILERTLRMSGNQEAMDEYENFKAKNNNHTANNKEI